jgi:uncharacterized protein (TIGR03437 family)
MLQQGRCHHRTALSLAGIACLFLPPLCHGQATSFNISTVAGNANEGFGGDNGAATGAQLNVPIQVAVDASHNIYIADSINNRIRKVSAGKISTVAGSNTIGYGGDGGPATKATLYDPYGVWIDSAGNLLIADLDNQLVRKVTANGNIGTVAGNTAEGAGFAGDGGPATSAQFYQPFGIVTDAAGNLYITDSGNHRIRKVDTSGNITTIAGTGVGPGPGGFSGDGGPAANASLNKPFGLSLDSAGNLYFADSGNNRIRKVDTNGIITTVAGIGTAGSAGDGGLATKAQLARPWDVKVDSAGDLFIADYTNSRIRLVTPDGVINTIAGGTGPGYTGDGANATAAKLNFPTGIAIDTNGDLYIADSGNNVIRQLTPTGPSVSAGGVVSAGAFGAFPAIAPGSWIEIYGANLSTDRRSWGTSDFQGAQAPTTLDGTGVTIGGQAAFVDFISGGQVNAQVPSNVATGSQTLTVKTPAGTTAAYTVTVNAIEPGLLTQFTVGGIQYAGAFFTDGTYVLPPGAVAGITSRRAKAGDTIVLYGIGFGPVTPTISAGQIVWQTNQLITAPQILIGQTPATVTFAGLVQNSVGLYQFNVVVPSVTAGDKVPVTFSIGGAAGTQTLYTAIQ